MFIKTLEQHGEPIAEFDAGMWGSMVEYITVDKDKGMTVTFKDGTEGRHKNNRETQQIGC